MRHWLPLLVAVFMLDASSAGTLSCTAPSETDIVALFERWNRTLQSADARAVVANYARRSVLLADGRRLPYLSAGAKQRYFQRLLKRRPAATVDQRQLEIACDTAVDAGTYTLHFADGSTQMLGYSLNYQRFGRQWLIVSHRSAVLPSLSALSRPDANCPARDPCHSAACPRYPGIPSSASAAPCGY